MRNYTKDEILKALDNNAPYNFFLDLEHGYFHTAGSRINLFADDNRWAIVFEKSGYGNRSGCANLELNYFGNCLLNLTPAGNRGQFISNFKIFELISGLEFQKIEGDFELVSKDARCIKVRDVELPIEQNKEKYINKDIEIENYDNQDELIDYKSLVRFLNETNPESFRATPEELRTCIPIDLRFIMKIDKWHHKSIPEYGGEKPSKYETFQLIADVLISRDPNKWKPTLEPNNDWRNWPEAGGL